MNSKHILLIEDNHAVSEVYKEYLKESGFYVAVIADGLDAIEKVKITKYSLILLDLMLPHVDGVDVLREIRKNVNRSTPVIILSNVSQEVVDEELKKYGYEGFINKLEATPEDILEKVREQIIL